MSSIKPYCTVEYLGHNQISVHLRGESTACVRSLFDQNTVAKLAAEKNELEMCKGVFAELIAYINVRATMSVLTSNNDRTLVELILPEEFWTTDAIKYMLQYAAYNVSTRVLRPGLQRTLQIVFNQKEVDSTAKLCINVLKADAVKETVSIEDNTPDPKAVFLKKIADYIGDQDIDHVTIVTKAGAKLRVDP